ncbi:STAS domain-containing protein [Streptomyces sp. NPDC005775]|uniref:STAS domain-containing protein n=1 Tax=Streptomyces sp. NPDC005775 TaxID=3364729 RepID=UPI0036AE9C9C
MTPANRPASRSVLTVTAHDTDDGVRVLSVTGELDLHQLDPLKQSLASAWRMDPPLRLLVIDLAAVGFCDSSGLNVFLQARQETHERGIELRLVNPSLPLRRVLQITGAAELFSLYDDLTQALA